MGAITIVPGSRTLLTSSALNSLASANYVSAGIVDVSAADPLDVVVEVEVTPGTVAGNKQVAVFAKVSLDGTNYSTGPESGSSSTDEANLKFLGVVPCASNATLQRQSFSLVAALGFVPPYTNIVVKNDTGAALASTGHSVNFAVYVGAAA